MHVVVSLGNALRLCELTELRICWVPVAPQDIKCVYSEIYYLYFLYAKSLLTLYTIYIY